MQNNKETYNGGRYKKAREWNLESGFFTTRIFYRCADCGSTNNIRGRDLWTASEDNRTQYHPCSNCGQRNIFAQADGQVLIWE